MKGSRRAVLREATCEAVLVPRADLYLTGHFEKLLWCRRSRGAGFERQLAPVAPRHGRLRVPLRLTAQQHLVAARSLLDAGCHGLIRS